MAYVKKYADWKRKQWFEIVAPQQIFNEAFLGETPAYYPKQVLNRRVEWNLALLTGDWRLQNAKVIFRIVKVHAGKAYTELEEYRLYDAYVRRIVRRGTDRIDDSFIVETRDGVKVRVMTLIITQHNTVRSKHTAIRKAVRELIINEAKEKDFYEFMKDIIFGYLQEKMRKVAHKIYPIEKAEIRRALRRIVVTEKGIEQFPV